MRGIVVGAVFSLFLWTALAWAVVCACTLFDVAWLAASASALMGSFACINLAAMSAAIWLAFVCSDEDHRDVFAFEAARVD